MVKNIKKREDFPLFVFKLITVATIYLATAKIGLLFSGENFNISSVWPPTGIAIAAIFLLGYTYWPAIFIGAFFANFVTSGKLISSLGIATGNALEALIIVFFIYLIAEGKKVFDTPRNVVTYTVIVMFGTMVSATIGLISLSLSDLARWNSYISNWVTWWIGDLMGALIIAPLIILWYKPLKIKAEFRRVIEGVLALISVFLSAIFIFTPLSKLALGNYPIPYLIIFPILWVAIRVGRRAVALSSFILVSVGIYGTLNGLGPFIHPFESESLIFVQLYLGVIAIMGLIVSSLNRSKKK